MSRGDRGRRIHCAERGRTGAAVRATAPLRPRTARRAADFERAVELLRWGTELCPPASGVHPEDRCSQSGRRTRGFTRTTLTFLDQARRSGPGWRPTLLTLTVSVKVVPPACRNGSLARDPALSGGR